MKNSNLFINLTCIIPALLILCMVNLKAQNDLIGYTYMDGGYGAVPHYYYISDCEATWDEANEAANEMGGYLASILNYNQNTFLGNWVEYYGDYGWEDPGAWIGYRGEQGQYEWANGDPSGWNLWFYDNAEPVYANGATLIGNRDVISTGEYYWITLPTTSEALYVVEFTNPPNCGNNPNKTYVCHNGNTICVNISALQSHLNHGDLEGPCGPCNIPAMQTLPYDGTEIDGHAIHEEKARLSIPEEELDIAQDKMISDQIQVFPNPASDEIHISLTEVHKEGMLSILSLTGQQLQTLPLHTQQSITIDLSTYAAGIYLIDIRSASGHFQKKFVKL